LDVTCYSISEHELEIAFQKWSLVSDTENLGKKEISSCQEGNFRPPISKRKKIFQPTYFKLKICRKSYHM